MSPMLLNTNIPLPPEEWGTTLLMFKVTFHLAPREPQRGIAFLLMIKGALTRAEKETKSNFSLSKASSYIY